MYHKLRAIKPTVGGYKWKTSLSLHDCILINRLRIGHTLLTHSYLLLGDDQPECGTCQCPLIPYVDNPFGEEMLS